MKRPYTLLGVLPAILFAVSAFLVSPARAADVTVSGYITTDTPWQSSNTYYVSGDVTVNNGVTLTVQAGTQVKFGSGTALIISSGGILKAIGSTTSTITFSASSTSPTTGFWSAIRLDSGASSTISYAAITYGGSVGSQGSIYNNGGILTVDTVTLATSTNYGIRNVTGTVSVINSNIATNQSDSGYGVYVEGGVATISSNTIHDNDEGIYATGPGTLSFTNNTFINNNNASVHLVLGGGLVFTNSGNTGSGTGKHRIDLAQSPTRSQTWNGDGIAYVVTNGMTLASGVRVDINPGAVVKIDGVGGYPFAYIEVGDGAVLNAKGSAGSIVYFTSLKDDSAEALGDSNNDSSTPDTNDWDTILVDAGASSTISYAVVRYGGYGYYGYRGLLDNEGGMLTVDNTETATSGEYGIRQTSGTSTITLSDLHDSGRGLDISGGVISVSKSAVHDQNRGCSISGGSLVVAGSEIHDNNYGIYVTGGSVSATSNLFKANSVFGIYSSSPSVDAPYNYWDDSTGPHNSTNNPSGTGNEVSDPVVFDPFNTQDHYLSSLGDGVDGNVIEWTGSTTFTDAFTAAVNTWNAEGKIDIYYVSSSPDITVSDIDDDQVDWAGFYNYAFHTLQFNEAHLRGIDPLIQQNAATHELGHALGLEHSYVGNIMHPPATTQVDLGWQDWRDYHYLWGY
ncbi:MAG: right-handed parallel beta-helix repeat-containing protein [Terriglobales bacterium]|jgi:parallel beta-helix repeat protein